MSWIIAHPIMTFILAFYGIAAFEKVGMSVASALVVRRLLKQLPAPKDGDS